MLRPGGGALGAWHYTAFGPKKTRKGSWTRERARRKRLACSHRPLPWFHLNFAPWGSRVSPWTLGPVKLRCRRSRLNLRPVLRMVQSALVYTTHTTLLFRTTATPLRSSTTRQSSVNVQPRADMGGSCHLQKQTIDRAVRHRITHEQPIAIQPAHDALHLLHHPAQGPRPHAIKLVPKDCHEASYWHVECCFRSTLSPCPWVTPLFPPSSVLLLLNAPWTMPCDRSNAVTHDHRIAHIL